MTITLNVKKLQEIGNKILAAIDNDNLPKADDISINDKIELVANGDVLEINTTNKSYYVKEKLALDTPANFRAVIDAKLFFSLLAKTTTEVLEIELTESTLITRGNGTYKYKLVYEGNSLVKIPEIELGQVRKEFKVKSAFLQSIVNNNLKTMVFSDLSPAQRYCYLDEQGCVTFTSSACINNFKLDEPVKLFLDPKLVKLFRLFKEEEDVTVTIGAYQLGSISQTRVKFVSGDTEITSITPTSAQLFEAFPADRLRRIVTAMLPYSASFEKETFVSALGRLMIFNNSYKSVYKNYGILEFGPEGLTIYDSKKANKEIVPYVSGDFTGHYETAVELNVLKLIFESASSEIIPLKFGNGRNIVVSRENICDIVQESTAVEE